MLHSQSACLPLPLPRRQLVSRLGCDRIRGVAQTLPSRWRPANTLHTLGHEQASTPQGSILPRSFELRPGSPLTSKRDGMEAQKEKRSGGEGR